MVLLNFERIPESTCGMRRRVQIQPNDVGGLLLKIRVVARHVAVEPLRLEAILGPLPRHHHLMEFGVFGFYMFQKPEASMCGTLELCGSKFF